MEKQAWLDLSDIKLEDVEVLRQEGAMGIPEFAASSCSGTCGKGSTCMEDAEEDAG